MKKMIVFICLLFTFTLFGCFSTSENESQTTPNQQPPITQTPSDAPDSGAGNDTESEDDGEREDEDDEQQTTLEKKKKLYLVSNTNSLRVRSLPNTSSTVLGYLDKNDALQLIGEQDGYYKTVFKEKTAFLHKSYCSVMEIECEDDKIESAISLGSSLLGYPYVWGSQRYHWGNGVLNKNYIHGEYDCSALVQFVYFKSNGVLLDLTSRAQSLNGVEVSKNALKRGDLMFFTNADRKNKTGIERIGHVGIYFGNNYILHTASDHAVIEPISTTRWSYYITARRVV